MIFATCYKNQNHTNTLPSYLTHNFCNFCWFLHWNFPFKFPFTHYCPIYFLLSPPPLPTPKTKGPKKSLMEWLDEFRLSETQKEDEEVGSINTDSCLCFLKRQFFSHPKCVCHRILMASWIGGTLWNVSFPSLFVHFQKHLPPILISLI